MKSHTVFYIHEKSVKFLQMASGKRLITGIDFIPIEGKTDIQISHALLVFAQKRRLNFKEIRVTVMIPRSRAILRFLTIPSQKPDEIRSMIDLQLEGLMPYTKNEVEFDFQVLSKTMDGYSKLVVVIVPREEAMRYWQIFAAAKIPVSGITISTVGLWSLYKQNPQVFDRAGAVLDLDRDHSEMCLCHKTQWLGSREIPAGLDQAKQWELTLAQAQKDKMTVDCVYLASSLESPQAAEQLAAIQKDLVVKNVVLSKLFQTAGGKPWPKTFTDEGLSFAALAGAAASPQNPPIDLVPEEVKKSWQQKTHTRRSWALGVWVFLSLLSLAAALSMGFFRQNMQLTRLDAQLHEARREALKVEQQTEKMDAIEKTIKTRLVFVQLANQISGLLPARIYLVNMDITNGNNLSLEGVASNPVEINQLQRDMVVSGKFADVNLNYVNKRVTQQGEVDYFKITCVINEVGNTQ